MRSTYNPLRRNRNIGTAKQGHGQNNDFTIPLVCHADRIWWENLGQDRLVNRNVGSLDLAFIIEDTRADCVHACTVKDVCNLLSLAPAADLTSLETFVFRQPTRKQWSVRPAWGRLAYSADLGLAGKKDRRQGPATFLKAVNPAKAWRWGRNLGPLDVLEVERLRGDGHVVEDTGKRLLFRSSQESIRATQLYRTLLHEIGHWVDWLMKVDRPAAKQSVPYEVLSDRYFARPRQVREQFVHRYASEMRERLMKAKRIPFASIPETDGGGRSPAVGWIMPDRPPPSCCAPESWAARRSVPAPAVFLRAA